jgi:hypothetical protein
MLLGRPASESGSLRQVPPPATPHPRPGAPLDTVHVGYAQEFGKLGLALNEDKSQVVDLTKGDSFGFRREVIATTVLFEPVIPS